MERQFQKLSRSGSGTRAFYLDRFLRIYPLFFAVLLLAWMANRLSWRNMAANVMLLPINYAEFMGFPVLIAPSWSLACEVHFYILVPMLVLCSTKTLRILAGASLCLFAVSPFLPLSTFWAFTGLPGVLFTFLSGILINRNDGGFIKTLWLAMLLMLTGFAATKLAHTGLGTGININVAIGYLVATAVVPLLDKFPANVKWDKFLGLFAYPLFLCHSPAAGFIHQHWGISQPFALLVASLILSASLILAVEIPFDRFRYSIRTAPAG